MPVVIPDWIRVNPSDFVQAAAAGGRLGSEIARMRTEAGIAAGRNQAGLEEANIRANSEAQQGQAERALKEWELQQQIKMQQNDIEGENARNRNTVLGENQRNQNMQSAEDQRAARALEEQKLYHAGMLAHYDAMSKVAQQKADQAANKPSPDDFATAHTTEVKPHDVYTINAPAIPHGTYWNPANWGSKDTPPSSITTTNTADLLGIPGNQITTNTIPGKPAMTWKVPNPSLEGKRVRNKETNETGVITNGEFVPDNDGDASDM